MAPYTKLFALCLLSATLAASSPLPADAAVAARSPEPSKSVQVIKTPDGNKFALVPVAEGGGVISVTPKKSEEAEKTKRDAEKSPNTDAVAYNPAYGYVYTEIYGYMTNYGYVN